MANPFSLEGKNAWITGASYGIGFNIAKAFVAAGVKKVVWDGDVPEPVENINWENIAAIIADNETGAARDFVIGIRRDGTIVTNRTVNPYVTDEEVAAFSDVVSVDSSSWGYTVCTNSKGEASEIGWDVDGARDVSVWTGLKTQ